VRYHSGGKAPALLFGWRYRSIQQAAATDLRPALVRINCDLAHSRQVNHQTIARAETCEAMPSAPDGRKDSGFGRAKYRSLHVANIYATR
jgi:hypothetical protein